MSALLLKQYWVRKLTGKPGGNTSPDCEFDTRRIHRLIYEVHISFLATWSNALRIQSDSQFSTFFKKEFVRRINRCLSPSGSDSFPSALARVFRVFRG